LPLVLELRTAYFLRDNRTSTEHTDTVYNSMPKVVRKFISTRRRVALLYRIWVHIVATWRLLCPT